MADKRAITLFFYEDGDGDQRVANTMPVFRDGGLRQPVDKNGNYIDGVVDMDICDEGRKVFGIDREVPANQIVRVTLTLDAVEVGEYEVRAEFKPFAPAPARRRASRG